MTIVIRYLCIWKYFAKYCDTITLGEGYMSENNKSAKLDSIKLVYNEKTKRIVANLITIVDGVKVRSRTIDNLEVIKVLIDALVKQSKLPVSELIDKGIITIDDRLVNKGVIILDNSKEYHKYIFDKDIGVFESMRLTRMEKKELGILVDGESYESFSEVKGDDVPKEDVSIAELVPTEEDKLDYINDDGNVLSNEDIPLDNINTDRHLLYELTEEIQKLNPDAKIRIGRIKADEDAGYRFFSSMPLESLVLPEKAYLDKDNSGWILVKSDSGDDIRFLIQDLKLADESKLVQSAREYIVENPKVEPAKNTEEVSEKEEKKSDVKHLWVNKKAIAALGVAGFLLVGSVLYGMNNGNINNNKDNSDTTMTRIEISNTNYNTDNLYNDADTNNLHNTNDINNSYIDISDVIQQIDSMCIPFRVCNFYDLVDDSDRLSLKVINEARNMAVNDRSKVVEVIDEYVKYVFEGRTMFEDGVIKGYDYLTPLSKYAVLVSGQTLLQLYPDYNYSTIHDVYTFDKLVDLFNDYLNETCNELNLYGRTI